MKTKNPIIVGINIGHDAGCAISVGGQIKIAISEERLTRRKYSAGWQQSLLYCLTSTDISLYDVDLVVYSCGGKHLPSKYTGGINLFSTNLKIKSVDHHLSHAIGSYCFSPFEEAVVVVCDALGNENNTESYYVANRQGLRRIGGNNPKRYRSRGIGATYEAFTNYLGFLDQESGKTMALAAYGDPFSIKQPLFQLKGLEVSSDLGEATHHWGVIDFRDKYNLPLGDPFPDTRSGVAQNIAAYIQFQSENILNELITKIIEKTNITNVCLSGGVALNCVANTKIRANPKVNNLYIFPAASDTGQAIGNALYGHYFLTGEISKQTKNNVYFGKEYSEVEILNALKREPRFTSFGKLITKGYSFSKETNIAHTTAQLLNEDKIVGWFQGRSEIGPRALGHRSIFADPRNKNNRDRLNFKVKRREWFRPFAPCIKKNNLLEFFGAKEISPYMLESPKVVSEKITELIAAIHVDNTARVQTIERSQDHQLYSLLDYFEQLTSVPAVLNTSFNQQEPIVETPGDALLTFLSSNLDYLVMGRYLIISK